LGGDAVVPNIASTTNAGRDFPSTVTVGTGAVSFDEVVAVARHGTPVVLSVAAEAEINVSRAVIDALADDTAPHYGVSPRSPSGNPEWRQLADIFIGSAG